ncbi:MAG: hypothetical protein GF408_02775 [Candidatus Omnitrophica bacterium]|nr:hypothetical protein [Candidatus Omnitrophota bacterium]
MMRKVLFLLRTYNDIDHITPVIWKALKEGEKPIVFFWEKYDHRADYRLRYLRDNYGLEIVYPGSVFGPLGKISLKFRYNRLFASRFLEKNGISACVFDYAPGLSREDILGKRGVPDFFGRGISDIREAFLAACRDTGVETFCLPHGLRVYMNEDPTERSRTLLEKTGKLSDMSDRNIYDHYVFQSRYHREDSIKRGMDPGKCHVWGSARFCPEWARTNLELCGDFSPAKDDSGRLKVVFMLSHWGYNIDEKALFSLVYAMADLPFVYLFVKDQPRGTGSLPAQDKEKLGRLPNVEVSCDNSQHSPAIIKWADVVMNFGSSIGIEALQQGKVLVNPSYIHTNYTVFDETEACIRAGSERDVLDLLEGINAGKDVRVPEENKRVLYREAVYGRDREYDVLGEYYSNIFKSQQ